MIEWQWAAYTDLDRDTLFKILQARQEIFIVEQDCPYLDIDHLDPLSWHLIGWLKNPNEKELVAYMRVTIPGEKYAEPSIGRVITTQRVRGQGIGNELMREGIARIEQQYPNIPIRIGAQVYLQKYYSSFGFENVGEPYDEDGIPHIEMLRNAS